MGLCPLALPLLARLWRSAHDVASRCGCERGCASCVLAGRGAGADALGAKAAAKTALLGLLGAWMMGGGGGGGAEEGPPEGA